MKICPKCNLNYNDETLQFCLQDGTQLEFAAPETTRLDMPPLEEDDETPTVIRKRRPERITFNLENETQEKLEYDPPINDPVVQTESRSSNTLLAVLLTAVGMLVVFGVVVGAWLYFGRTQNPIVANSASNSTNAPDKEPKSNTNVSPAKPERTPVPEKSIEATPDKSPAIDQKQIVKAVSDQISSWKSLTESRDLKAYMGKYSSRLNYYSKRNASKSFVEADKRRAFTNYTSIKSKLTNIKITSSSKGERATAVFDKEWDFSGPGKSTSGKVQTELIFKKTGDQWLIVSERDLKVYYVNK